MLDKVRSLQVRNGHSTVIWSLKAYHSLKLTWIFLLYILWTETKYMRCDFGAIRYEGEDVSLGGEIVFKKKKKSFDI